MQQAIPAAPLNPKFAESVQCASVGVSVAATGTDLITVHRGGFGASLSFPSGHAMLSAITYLTLGALLARAQSRWRIKIFILFTGVLITLLIGLSRVYLGVHWPTDVLAGWTIGSIWALVLWLVAETVPIKGRPC
jgi:membrane-associated phospholipid phosphatase